MKLYFISGLGADERVFQRLESGLPENILVHHIKWPEVSSGESLGSYRDKIISLIDTSQEFGIIGLSFGGILASEIARTISPKVTILLSSISNAGEMPWKYKLLGSMKLNKLVPTFLLNKVYPFTNWYFGISEGADKKLLKSVIHATPPHFLKWAINEIINWKEKMRPDNVFHIHGECDRLFPAKLTHADKIIPNAGHLMVHTHARSVGQAIREWIDNR